ncbi:Heparan sulfate 6-o-sulfotransferase [Operophtera brumata]|uniref:Heparan sulfate 6-o-sulfotransferase n=1 Tax=Operophtera brumata TaxID=104452 RepID=A0A0L7KXX6_OPEBR|nr:Heparan sulfate 6-o-sulfotransferase [Operophtera brumata]
MQTAKSRAGASIFRFEALKKRDSDFEYRWRHLGEVARNGVTEFDWDSNLEDATTEKYRGK